MKISVPLITLALTACASSGAKPERNPSTYVAPGGLGAGLHKDICGVFHQGAGNLGRIWLFFRIPSKEAREGYYDLHVPFNNPSWPNPMRDNESYCLDGEVKLEHYPDSGDAYEEPELVETIYPSAVRDKNGRNIPLRY